MLLNLYPYLEDAVYFYAGRNNQSQTVRFAQAYVDLSLIYAFSNENITNRENYPLITIFVATKLFNQKTIAMLFLITVHTSLRQTHNTARRLS